MLKVVLKSQEREDGTEGWGGPTQDELARRGAQEMLHRALEAEVAA